MRGKISVRTALIVMITALVLQYFLLEGFAAASGSKVYSILASASVNFGPSQIQVNDYTIRLEVPDATQIQASPDQGEEMQFSIYFFNSDLAFRGYLQVWKLKDLESFLKNSRNLSPFDFLSYNMSTLKQSYDDGFQTEWSADFGDKVISGREFWWKLNSTKEDVVRVSFYTDTAEFPKSLDSVIQHVLNSLQVVPDRII